MTKRTDMAGTRYGLLLAICDVGRVSSGDRKWKFACDCGSQFEAAGYAVRSGRVVSCPSCAAKRTVAASITHGKTDTDEYRIWTGILTRCKNPKSKAYQSYGGRGIGVCDQWANSFESFLEDMGARPSKNHSIDRRDNDGDYEPGNCRWATRAEQAANKRNTVRVQIGGELVRVPDLAERVGITRSAIHLRLKKNVIDPTKGSQRNGCVTYQGVTDTYSGWSRRTGIKPSTIAMRLKAYGWSIEKALTQGASL